MEKVSILLVEDEYFVGVNLKAQLEELGYEVINIVDTGQKALDTLEQQKPDLILMDIHIKGEMDGIETAQRINQNHHLPIMYLTADNTNDTFKRARNTRLVNFIDKSTSTTSLGKQIEVALQNFPPPPPKDSVAIKEHSNNRSIEWIIKLNDILYFEAARSSCDIHLQNGKKMMQSKSMKSVLEELDLMTDERFLQIHRSHTINFDYVVGYDRSSNSVIIKGEKGEKFLSVGKTYQDVFHARFKLI